MSLRRRFIRQLSLSTAALGMAPRAFGALAAKDTASFFLVGDTHYHADEKDFSKMDAVSADYNERLVGWLNKLPGTEFTTETGGGPVSAPHGVIHVGDLIDSGDKTGPKAKMIGTEVKAWTADWGLNGRDGKLHWPVREMHGNHDGPHGDTPMVKEIIARNKRRSGIASVSPSGLHYSWDWAGVHFVALGIVVGDAPEVKRKRRYAPLGSLPFLKQDLEKNVGTSGRPVVLLHHVDVHRYSVTVPDDKVANSEWDYGDAQAFYKVVQPYRIAAGFCGHTHGRKIVRWNGTKDEKAADGFPFLNTDNAGHFSSPAQAFFHIEITPSELRAREFFTKDGWKTGAWTPQMWKFPIRA